MQYPQTLAILVEHLRRCPTKTDLYSSVFDQSSLHKRDSADVISVVRGAIDDVYCVLSSLYDVRRPHIVKFQNIGAIQRDPHRCQIHLSRLQQ